MTHHHPVRAAPGRDDRLAPLLDTLAMLALHRLDQAGDDVGTLVADATVALVGLSGHLPGLPANPIADVDALLAIADKQATGLSLAADGEFAVRLSEAARILHRARIRRTVTRPHAPHAA